MSFTVAIIGRPNVGKSTLFNRLVGKRLAIVHDKPGVTRDRKEGQANLAGMTFRVIDTAGLEEAFDDSIEGRMRSQTERALQDADVALMLIDARAGVTPLDKHFADLLRKSKTPVILVANKCEGRAGQPGLYEAYGLGLGEPVPVSAEHGEGMYELFEVLRPFSKEEAEAEQDEDFPEDEAEAASAGEGEDDDEILVEDDSDLLRPLQLAIVGRPNVGKSTLVNRLLGEERVVTGPEAGLTRDAITVEWEYQSRPIRLVDTAGMRRRAVITDQVEKLSVAESLESIRMAQVVVLVLDSSAILDKQDLTIARMVIEEGRALVIAVNKWDVVEDRAEALQRLNDRLESSLPQVRGIPTVTMSALTGRGVDKLMNAVIGTYDVWRKRIPTGQLNRWLEEMTERHPPPVGQQGKRIRLRYMTQAKSRPPTFIIFTTRPEELPESYTRYLVNGMREVFGMPGVPIRFYLRKRKNPFVDD